MMWSYLFIFALVAFAFSIKSQEIIAKMSRSLLSMFSLGNFMVSSLTLRSFFFFSFFLSLHLWHMEVYGLGPESEMQPRRMPQPQQHWILNALSEARY